ncbi:tRNA pseudouridine synthase A [Firmicutes bacterium CAG:884]|nr:tRNA pseudouridine synthase A [Firmicutes bacterium CAG:884]
MRYFMRFSYNGSKFNGFQKQVDKRTVQGDLESVLSKIFNENIRVVASGRTDAGVHAYNQCLHFDSSKEVDFDKLKFSLNSLLHNIYVKELYSVPDDFHARYDCTKKEYIYKINVGEFDPIYEEYIYQYNKSLDIEKMKDACMYLIGEHDFRSFTSLDYEKNCVRTIYSIDISIENDIIYIDFVGNGFLKYMVRNMVGLLIEVGSNNRNVEDVKKILDSMDRKEAGICAPSMGLYLANVYYC